MNTPSERERIKTLLFYAFVLVLAYFVFQLFRPFLVPLGWAGVLVVFFHPWHERLERRYGPTLGATLSTITVIFIVIVPTLFVMTAFINESVRVFDEIRRAFAEGRFDWAERLWDRIQRPAATDGFADLGKVAEDVTRQAAGLVASKVGTVLQNVALILFDLVVTLFATFFLFRDAPLIVNGIRNALPFEPVVRDRMMTQTRELISASVVAGMAVAAVQGALGGLTFAILGLGAPVFWGVVMTIFCLLPLGAWVVWLPVAMWLMANGDMTRGLVLVGVGAGVVSAVDNFLRPAMLAGRARLSGLLVLIALIGGVAAFGVLGIVLGPILIATAAGLLEAYTSTGEPVIEQAKS